MLSHRREPEKARHYLDLLDNARCNAQWQEIPELTRKVSKHSPQRQCLTLTAQTERHIAELSSSRPATSSSTGLSQAMPLLEAAVEKEKTFREDAFQGKVCLAWLHGTVGDSSLALSSLPTAIDQAPERLKQEGGITAKWTHVCIVKGAYIRGTSLEAEDRVREAARTYASMLPYISNLPTTFSSVPEHQLWTEKLLARYCILASRHVTSNAERPEELLSSTSLIAPGSILSPFRAYANLYDAKKTTADNDMAMDGGSSHGRTWKAYYDAVSVMVQNGIVQPVFKSRLQQGVELKRVEAFYQATLLKEVKFPRADQANSQIESWVDQVMANWRVMCGPKWLDEDLGGGGKAALGHGVLDILYKAATRTFHSTRVLRHLFTVYAALAEFNLASKALDSYLEILTKGKARIKKSGEAEIGLDDDATALATAAAGIKMLCAYGRRKDAEKALSIAGTTEKWLRDLHPGSSAEPVVSADDVPQDLVDQPRTTKPPVPGKVLALGYHALGISQACWARLTYETSARSTLQAKAISNFRTALNPDIGVEDDIEILYSLALVLTETRDIDAAIGTVKRALSVDTDGSKTKGVSATDFAADSIEDESKLDPHARGRLLRCWHLLALLLSARQSFTTAVASCEAALDIYGGKSILYGDVKLQDSIANLTLLEKKAIIEIKMTQLVLAEVIDGAEEAVNTSGELLGLYTKLFKYSEKKTLKGQENNLTPPPSANETTRSFRGSFLRLPKDPSLKSRNADVKAENTTSSSLRSYEPPDESIRPPTISVTGGDGDTLPQDPNHHANFLGRNESNKLRKPNSKKSMASRRQSRAASPARPATATSAHPHLHLGLPHRGRHNGPILVVDPDDGSQYNGSYDSNEVGVAVSHDVPSVPTTPAATSDPPNPLHNISPATQNMNHRNQNRFPISPKPPQSQNTQPQTTSPSIFTPPPEPHFSPAEQQRHASTLLTKIWLLIASLYRCAGMQVDAQGALSEATTYVQSIETAIATRDGSSAENFATPGYGKLKSCGELWADVLAEQAALHIATENMSQASAAYEKALGHCPNHVAATVGLSNILLDAYSKPPLGEPAPVTETPKSIPTLASLPTVSSGQPTQLSTPSDLLSRLAARDRAYGLLSALTKSGSGWDCSEAWYALAEAYEKGGQVEKAKEALWWVVELEDGRGVRAWGCVV